MCRWAAYIGKPIFLEEVVSRPRHSLIHQSQCATECKSAINADGFGLAWYDEREEPGLFRDVSPAWSDCNLKSIVQQVRSRLFLSHVRASTGTATSRNNCHPFAFRNWSFMHNGQVGGFEHFRRCGDMMIPDEYYADRRGATDSEALFLVALSEGLDHDPCAALERATARFEALSRARGTAPHIRMTVAFSDGRRLYAVRYATDDKAPTLYHRWSKTHQGRAVVSEPLETDEKDWQLVPAGTFCTFEGARVDMKPFIPQQQEIAA
ncbi:class II glutamine amidotransferase [Pseudorhodobacter aquimaris]|uniref:class II glutamine amidotransferase n=1 Tax=Pseudorhodobacter aquimaris TaxID=687412 RepID=UPI00067C379F|nr:class II glutamine amidotransferase [Pseudorhodobacter aquimaris]